MHIDEFCPSRLFHMAQESILERRMDDGQLRFVSKSLNIHIRYNNLSPLRLFQEFSFSRCSTVRAF